MNNKGHILLYLAVVSLLGCTSSKLGNTTSQRPLVHFQDANFGVSFSHTDTLTTSYNPHGGADRVIITYQENPMGGLIIRPAPPAGSIEDFIAAGKEYYKTEYGASSVEYTLYETPHKYKFHYIRAEVTVEDDEYVVESFVYLREPKKLPSKSLALDALEAISGAFFFEFLYHKTNYERLKPEIRTVIDTFKITENP